MEKIVKDNKIIIFLSKVLKLKKKKIKREIERLKFENNLRNSNRKER